MKNVFLYTARFRVIGARWPMLVCLCLFLLPAYSFAEKKKLLFLVDEHGKWKNPGIVSPEPFKKMLTVIDYNPSGVSEEMPLNTGYGGGGHLGWGKDAVNAVNEELNPFDPGKTRMDDFEKFTDDAGDVYYKFKPGKAPAEYKDLLYFPAGEDGTMVGIDPKTIQQQEQEDQPEARELPPAERRGISPEAAANLLDPQPVRPPEGTDARPMPAADGPGAAQGTSTLPPGVKILPVEQSAPDRATQETKGPEKTEKPDAGEGAVLGITAGNILPKKDTPGAGAGGELGIMAGNKDLKPPAGAGAGIGVETGIARGMSTLPPKLPPPPGQPAQDVQPQPVAMQQPVTPGRAVHPWNSISLNYTALSTSVASRLKEVSERMLFKCRIDDTKADTLLSQEEKDRRIAAYSQKMREYDERIPQIDRAIGEEMQALKGFCDRYAGAGDDTRTDPAVRKALNGYFAELKKGIECYEESIRTMNKANDFLNTHSRKDCAKDPATLWPTYVWVTSVMTPFGVSPGNSNNNFWIDASKAIERGDRRFSEANKSVPPDVNGECQKEANRLLASPAQTKIAEDRAAAAPAAPHFDRTGEFEDELLVEAPPQKPRKTRGSKTDVHANGRSEYPYNRTGPIGGSSGSREFSLQGNMMKQQRYTGQQQPQANVQPRKAEQPSRGNRYPP